MRFVSATTKRIGLFCMMMAVITIIALTDSGIASQKSGLDPSRLRLPKGPGSLDGIGENAEPSINAGSLQYSIPITLPEGYQGFTPSVSLTYNSAAGNSEVGIGWSMSLPQIERMTARGLPQYWKEDTFVVNGSDELVALRGSKTYRARFESSFVRYTWIDPEENGRNGYWTAEHPDGRIEYFGADATGTNIPLARATGSEGTFSYMLVESVDVYGHHIRYQYIKDGSRPLLSEIEWVYDGSIPLYRVAITYEDRRDAGANGKTGDRLSDGKPGFELALTKRVGHVTIFARGKQLRHYAMGYESYTATGGLTRLKRVRTFGTDDNQAHLVELEFTYTGVGDRLCSSGSCSPAYVHTMVSVGVDFATRQADLLDINGDGLPDILDTSSGYHKFHLNCLGADGTHIFLPPSSSQTAGTGAALLSAPGVEPVDLNGDGLADLVDGPNKRVLWNGASGDWQISEELETSLPDLSANANLRFFDYNGDKKPDILFADHGTSSYYLNEEDGSFSKQAIIGESIGWGFSEDGLRLADMNGDGLQDAVIVLPGGVVAYRMYLGRGRWGGRVEMSALPRGWLPQEVQFVDINGDGLSDVVVVLADRVFYAINRNSEEFSTPIEIGEASGLAIPEKTSSVSVRFADMNGTGSTDVVWIDASGKVTYLDLFPERPNLLRRIDNHIGKVIEASYGSSIMHMARDRETIPWSNWVPMPMTTLDTLKTYDTLTNMIQWQEFLYHDGYFDGEERQFRGFARVDVVSLGDSSVETGKTSYDFDVGKTDRYRKGRLLSREAYSSGKPLEKTTNIYEDCSLSDVPEGTALPVRYVCQVATSQVIKEGRPQSEWVTVETQSQYDGYGNIKLQANLGVTRIGNAACGPCGDNTLAFGAPCGMDCHGDEMFEEQKFIPPEAAGGKWLLRLPYSKRTMGRIGSKIYKEELYYYDGEPFVGLQLRNATLGNVTRVTRKVMPDKDTTVAIARNRYDEHGNIRETLDANKHRRIYDYDSGGLLLSKEKVHFDDPERNPPYALLREVVYHPVLDQVVEATSWMRSELGGNVSPRNVTSYAYDVFGRLTKIAEPGDSLTLPTWEFQYDLSDPISRIITRERSITSGDLDLESIQCFDGLGRKLQSRTMIAPGLYQVSGLVIFNVLGQQRQVLQPFTSKASACDQSGPPTALSTKFFFDASGRVRKEILPDDEIYASASSTITTYTPITTSSLDEEDTDLSSPHANTPIVTVRNGLGRIVRIDRFLKSRGEPISTRYFYDELGRLSGVLDPGGNTRRFYYDLLDRIVKIEDPDAGTLIREYDPAGNFVGELDARNVRLKMSYDEANRLAEEWDADARNETLVTYSYDKASSCPDESSCGNSEGRLTSVIYPTGADYFGYDIRGRTSYSARVLDKIPFAIWNEYDNVGRMIRRTYPSRLSVSFEYDGAGRLTGIPGYVPFVGYGGRGQQNYVRLGNGSVTKSAYDERMRLKRLSTVSLSGEVFQDYEYTRDRVGNIKTIIDRRRPDGGASANSEYVYDAWYRLNSATLGSVGDPYAEVLSVTYDTIDNITSKTSSLDDASPDHVGAYKYAPNRPQSVIQAGTISFDYDKVGNMTLRGQQSLQWDHKHRLLKVVEADKTLMAADYGASYDRVRKLEGASESLYIADDFEVRDGSGIVYVSIGGSRVAKVQFPYPNCSESVDDAPAQSERLSQLTPSLIYLHQNHLGSTAAWSSTAGNLIGRAEYYPFGSPKFESGDYLEGYSFAGQERDASVGFSYHSARYLDTKLARWVSPDPSFLNEPERSLEKSPERLYSYVRGNPVNNIDPSGLQGVDPDTTKQDEQQIVFPWQDHTNAYIRGQEAGRLQLTAVQNLAIPQRIGGSVRSMLRSASREGIRLHLNSAFRSQAEQWELYAERALGFRVDVVARPGFSIHQEGRAIDVATGGGVMRAFVPDRGQPVYNNRGRCTNCIRYTDSTTYRWLAAHAREFGFIRTVSSEPWHLEWDQTRAQSGGGVQWLPDENDTLTEWVRRGR